MNITHKCPHCKSSYSYQIMCKSCNANFCIICGKTQQGVPVAIEHSGECPVCQTYNNMCYVDYSQESFIENLNQILSFSAMWTKLELQMLINN